MNRNEYDNEDVFKFLQLLKVPINRRCKLNLQYKPLSLEEWINKVKLSKKRSTSSIFSNHTYAVYKCALESEFMIQILVVFYNALIKEGYYLRR